MRSHGLSFRRVSSPLFLLSFLFVFSIGCGSLGRSENTAESNSAPAAEQGEAATGEDAYCERTYQETLSRLGEDFDVCLRDVGAEMRECTKPDGFGNANVGRRLNVIVALDSSGSMAGRIGGRLKIEIARSAIDGFVGSLPDDAAIGLIAYGHKGSNSEANKQASCAGVDTIYPLGELRKSEFLKAVNSFEPRGWTPVAGAIDKAREELSVHPDAANIVYVVSDGIETCGGDPVAAARALHGSDAKAIVNIIGFDVDNAAQKQLRAAAEAGGGQYFDARDGEELRRVMGGVSRSLAQYREYIRCMTANRQDLKRIYRNGAAAISNCVFVRVTKESRSLFSEVQAWNRNNDPRSRCGTYISRRHNDREKAIKAWRDELVRDIDERQGIAYDELERELRSVTEKGPPPR